MALRAIKDFPKATPSTEDLILIEQQGGGRSVSLKELPVSTPVEKKISDVQKDLNARITALAFEPGDTTGDAELRDIRNPADGFTVPAETNAGGAVRAQVTQLDEKISNLKGDLTSVDFRLSESITEISDVLGFDEYPKRGAVFCENINMYYVAVKELTLYENVRYLITVTCDDIETGIYVHVRNSDGISQLSNTLTGSLTYGFVTSKTLEGAMITVTSTKKNFKANISIDKDIKDENVIDKFNRRFDSILTSIPQNVKQGWITYPDGYEIPNNTRCMTNILSIKKGTSLKIVPNGMDYTIAKIDDTNGQATVYKDWVTNNLVTEFRFETNTLVRVAVRNGDNSEVTPSEVTAKIYINDVPVFDELFNDIDHITNYKAVTEIELRNAFISDGKEIASNYARALLFDSEKNNYYKLELLNNNRLIVYGYKDSTYTLIDRLQNTDVTGHDIFFFNSGDYDKIFVQIWYEEHYQTDLHYAVYYGKTDDFDTFKVNYIPVVTKNDIEPILTKIDDISLGFNVEITTVSNLGNISVDGNNLCLVAQKQIYTNGEMPNVTGYLYLDIYEQKLYYSATIPDNPIYLCDWNEDIAYSSSGMSAYRNADRWHFTITKHGDIICLANYARCKPIVYPHGNYNSPVLVDGLSTNPYGFLTQQSAVHLDNGDMYFGEYAVHYELNEQNNDRRNIWKVTAPYTNSSNWTIEHSFKHVYYTSPVSDEPTNEIGHIHSVTFDFYTNTVYANTGDIGRHVRIWRKKLPNGTWSECAVGIGDGQDTEASQKFRVVNLLYTKDACWWANDSFNELHNLYKASRDANGDVDFSTTVKVTNLEMFDGRSNENRQPTYINVLLRNPNGILFIDRAEERKDRKLDIVFYSFDKEKAYICGTFEKVPETNGLFNMGDKAGIPNRLGFPNQCAVGYQPFNTDYVMIGGATHIRMNQVDLFNNSPDSYVGTLKIKINAN